jgi:hypothetical protein
MSQGLKEVLAWAGVGLAILVFVAFLFWVFPVYNVWQQGMSGQSELSKAEYSKKVAVQEALAKKESSTLLAEAEVERAKGVAKANEIIGVSLKNNESYLRYLWIQGMQTNQMQVVYIPTEANLPILEAGRWKEMQK